MGRQREIMLFNVGGGGINGHGNPLPTSIVDVKIGNAKGFSNIGTQTFFTGSERSSIHSDKITIPATFYRRQAFILAKNEQREWQVFSIIKPENVVEGGKRNQNLISLVLREHVNAGLLAQAINLYEQRLKERVAVRNGA